MSSKTLRVRLLIATALVLSAVGIVVATASAFIAGNLSLQGNLRLTSTAVTCPAEAPSGAIECRARTGSGSIPGLGGVSETYLWSYGSGSPPCPATLVKPLATTGRFVVAGKGEINFALTQGARCVDLEPVRNEPQDFTITGGTGSYQGATGSGNVQPAVSEGVGSEKWTGTISVPGFEFDVTPPTLSGATSKTVRAPRGAKRVRVTYKVAASDNADAQVPVTCTPRSGSRFPIGHTAVRCSATDSSGNIANAAFRITVRRSRVTAV